MIISLFQAIDSLEQLYDGIILNEIDAQNCF